MTRVILIALLACGCAREEVQVCLPPDRPDDPGLVTSEHAIPVWAIGIVPDWDVVERYLDAAESTLLVRLVMPVVSDVDLYAPGCLFHRGRPVGGIAVVGSPAAGMKIEWSYRGASAYAHERIHQAGFHHPDGTAEWPTSWLNDIEQDATLAGWEAAFGAES